MFSTQSDALRPAPPAPGDVRHQLGRILDNGLFLRSPRVSRFLRFVVERALADTTAELKESVIGIEVFDLEADYNPQENPVVRNTAVRLRLKLEAYYHGDGSADPVLIELPLGRYVPFFTWQALAPAAAPLEADPELHKQVRAVGRDREFEQLKSALRGVLRGQRQVVKVSGDAGLGKTTLVEEFLRGIEDSAWILKGRCSESLSRNEAYVAVLEALDTLIHNPLAEQTVSLMGEHAPSWLAQVLPGKAAESRTGAVSSQEKMRREFAHFVLVLCRLRPAILFLDDMHWADASTCDLLSYLQGISADFRLLVVLTFRPAELVSIPHPFRALEVELSRQGGSDIFLRPLNALDVEAYIHRGFPVNSFPSDLGRIVFERTEGHPLFMADVVGHLRESGLVAAVNGRWEMTAQADLLRSLVPATTQRLIRLQIDQLTAERVRILECAAVQGARFDTAVVATALGLDPGAVEEELRRLETERRFVSSEEDLWQDSYGGPVLYRFTHALYQQEFDHRLSCGQRASLGRALANALVKERGDEAGAEAALIGALFELGGDMDKASEYFLLAARSAARIFAFPEAMALATRGLKALRRTPESPERDAREFSFHLNLGMAQMSTLGLPQIWSESGSMWAGYAAPEVDQTYRRARDLCVKLGENRDLSRILWRLHTCQVNAGNLRGAIKLSEEMLSVAAQVGTRNAIVEALFAQGSTMLCMGRLREAKAAFERIFEVAPLTDHQFDTSLYVLDPCVISLSLLARLVAMEGHFDDAMTKANLSLELASNLTHPPSMTYAKFWVGWISNLAGDHQPAIDSVGAVMQAAKEQGLPQFVEWGRIVLGSSLAAMGNAKEGISQMEQSLGNQLAMHCLVERPYCLTLLAEAVLRNGDPERAAQLCTEALALALASEGRNFEAESHRVRAEAWFSLNRVPEAETECQVALSVARAAGCGALELRAARSHLRIARARPGSDYDVAASS